MGVGKKKWQRRDSNPRPKAYESSDPLQLLNTLSVTEISELSKLWNFQKGISKVSLVSTYFSKKTVKRIYKSRSLRKNKERTLKRGKFRQKSLLVECCMARRRVRRFIVAHSGLMFSGATYTQFFLYLNHSYYPLAD